MLLYPRLTSGVPDQPCWNTAQECSYDYYDVGGKEFARGNRKNMKQWALMFYFSLTNDCRILFDILMYWIPQAPDHCRKTYYIERFLLLKKEQLQKMCEYIQHNTREKMPNINECFTNMEISLFFLLEARRYSKWTNKSWNKVRGKVALEHRWSTFWCNDELRDLRIKFLVNNKQTSYHALDLDEKDLEATKQVLSYKTTTVAAAQGTPFTLVDLNGWHKRKFYSQCCGTASWCNSLIWSFFNIPKTSPKKNDNSFVASGVLKFGTSNSYLTKYPSFVFGPRQLEPFINANQVLRALYNEYHQCVCYVMFLQ